jgi:hypothetical protein
MTAVDFLHAMYQAKRGRKPDPDPEPKPPAVDFGQGARGVPTPPAPPTGDEYFQAMGRAARYKTSVEAELERGHR